MKKLISVELAAKLLMIFFIIMSVFHLLILIKIIPFELVWGGKLKSVSDMIVFETISIISTLLMLSIILIKLRFININISSRNYRIIFLAICLLFILNTFGNIFSENFIESIIFTPLTLIASLLAFRLSLSN